MIKVEINKYKRKITDIIKKEKGHKKYGTLSIP